MNQLTIDTRGLSCPEPVYLVQKAIKAGNMPLLVFGDSTVALENITRLVQAQHLSIQPHKSSPDEFKILIFDKTKGNDSPHE